MKKTILFSILTVITILTVTTAAKAQKGFYAGVRGAAQLSVMFNETDADRPEADYRSKWGTSFGVNGGYNFTEHMGVGVEVNYSKTKQRYSDNSSNYTQKFNYLKIPVLFTYNTNPEKRIIFTAKAGPQLNVLLKSSISGATNSQLNGSSMDRYKKVTLGAMAGVGVRVQLFDRMYLDAGIQMDGSFSNTEKSNYKNSISGRSKSHDLNAGFEVGVKYMF